MEKETVRGHKKMQGLQNTRSRISISLLLSYLVILIVPFFAQIIIYYTASNLLLQIQITKVSSSLANTVTTLDRQLEETYNVGRYISNDPQVLKLCRKDGEEVKKASYYDLYEITTNFPNYNLTNQIIQNVYMFFREQDYVVKLPTLVPAKENAYQTLDFVGGLSYEDCIRQYTGEYYEGNIFHIASDQTDKDYYLMLQSFPYGTVGQPYGVTVFVLNQKLILEQISSVLDSSEGISVICDQEGRIIQSVVGKGASPDDGDIHLKLDTGLEGYNVSVNGKTYVACIQKSEVAPWYIASLTPQSDLLQRIGWMRYAIILLSAASVGIALFICILKWKLNARVLSRYCDFRTALNGQEETCKSFWKSLPLFLDSVEGLQAEMKEQKSILRTEILRKILFNEYSSREDMLRDLRLSELDLRAGFYSIAVIRIDDIHHHAENKSGAACSQIREFLQQREDMRYLAYEINNLSTAVVVMKDTPRETEDFRNIFYHLIVALQEKYNVQLFIGLSGETEDLAKLHQGYYQALKVSEYLKYYDLRIPMTESELPANTNNFYFPVELELRFTQAILRGKSEELDHIMQEINHENIISRKLNITMLSHLTDMIRCTSIRALKEAETEALDEWIRAIAQSMKLEEIFANVREAKRLIEDEEKDRQSEAKVKLKGEVESYINQNYNNYEFNISMLSEHLQMPENKLYQEFKSTFGVSLSEYLETLRMNMACQLLREGVSVKMVAAMVGYGSDYSFRRAFKRVIGVSPSIYADIRTIKDGKQEEIVSFSEK
jgi:two-component system response regulator YesN